MKVDWQHIMDPYEALIIIDEMLESDDYEFASDFLGSVREQVAENDYISESQAQAVANVFNSKRG